MTRRHPTRQRWAPLGIAASVTALLATSLPGTVVAQGDEPSGVFEGRTPKALNAVGPLRWYADPAESSEPGSILPDEADLVAVGVAIREGPGKIRSQAIRRRGKPNVAVANDANVGKGETLAWVVANFDGKMPKKLKSDVVLWVGAMGPDSVPYDAAGHDSMTAGTSAVHVIGRYGSQQLAPWLTADDSTAGDAPGGQLDFDIPGSGVGGYDPKTRSIWTSFVLPKDTSHLTIGVYTTDGGFQLDPLSGLGHTYRIPVTPSVDVFECAKVDLFPGFGEDGGATGIFDIKATLVEPPTPDAAGLPRQYAMAFESSGAGPGSAPVEALPESPAGSGVTYWHGTVPGGTVALDMPGSTPWYDGPGDQLPAVADALDGVRLDATGERGGTVFGSETCGNFLAFEGCEHGGGSLFWDGLVSAATGPAGVDSGVTSEFPVRFPGGAPYCVVVPEGADVPLVAFGVDPRPFTLPGHEHAMESNSCGPIPVDLGVGGVMSRCPDGTVTFRWLETGSDTAVDADPGWGFRMETTILPEGLPALGLTDPGSMLPPPAYAYMSEHARALLAEAGWAGDDEDGYDFSGGPIGE